MLKWAPYPFVRFALALIAGIVFYIQTHFYSPVFLYLFVGLGLIYSLLAQSSYTVPGRLIRMLPGMLGLLCLFLAGIIITHQRTATHNANHVLQVKDSIAYYQAVVSSAVQEKAKSYKVEVEVLAVHSTGQWKKVSGKVLVYIKKESVAPAYGDILMIKGSPALVRPPANPDEFDYRRYLQYQQVFYQHYVVPSQYLTIGHTTPNPLTAWAIQTSTFAAAKLKAAVNSTREHAIASALILGVRDDLDNEILQAYASSGAMHVLSVSGLHVGIIFAILAMLLDRIKKVRYGNVVFALIILALLWFYAFITALSPSVLRSVTMFSFVVVAEAVRRKSNIYNTLALSAFVLLCYDPYMIMSAGFQLSYLAVAGIVYLYPKLYHSLVISDSYAAYRKWPWKLKKSQRQYHLLAFSLFQKGLDWFWQITCVSIAAQLATFPLSVFYFHQFPNYFLLSNPAVIVLSSVALVVGLAVVFFCWVPVLADWLGSIVKYSIAWLNESVFFTERLPYAVWGNLQVDLVEMLLVYTAIVMVLCLLYYYRFRYVWLLFFVALAWAGVNGVDLWHQKRQQALVFHSIPRESAMTLVDGQRGVLVASPKLLQNKRTLNFHVTNYWIRRGITEQHRLAMGKDDGSKMLAFRHFDGFSLGVWRGKRFLFLTASLPKRRIKLPARIDFLVIQNNSVRNLASSIADLRVDKIILDGSNKPYLAEKLVQQATALKIPCHNTISQGAFTLDLLE